MSAEAAKQFQSLVKRLRSKFPGEPAADPPGYDDADPVVSSLVYSMLLWESTSAAASTMHRRLHEALVDYNELRVCLPREVAGILGDRYPRAAERAERLCAVLQDLYKRSHLVTLAPLATAPKREARQFLEGLDGMPAFVAARVFLVNFGGHAIPVDERLLELLIAENAAPDEPTPESASLWLERHVRAADARQVHAALQAWSDAGGLGGQRAAARKGAEKRRPASKAAPRRKPAKE